MTRAPDSRFCCAERVLLALAAVVLVLAAGVIAYFHELRQSAEAFESDARLAATQVSRQMLEGRTLVTALHGLFQGTPERVEAQLPDMARRITVDYPQVRWIAYAQRVAASDREKFEQRLQIDGFLGFTIHPFVHATHDAFSNHLLPISHIEPLTPLLARHLGADLHSPSSWQTAIQEAVDTGEVRAVATNGQYLGRPGFLVLRATYRGNVPPNDAATRRSHTSGLVLAFLDREAMLGRVRLTEPTALVELRDGSESPPLGETDIDAEAGDGLLARLRADLLRPMRSRVVELPFSNPRVRLAVSARPQPHMDPVLASMFLAALVAVSALLALGQWRRARREELQARAQARLAQVTLHSIGEAVVRLDDDGRIHYMNPTAERMGGISLGDAAGRHLDQVFRMDFEGQVDENTLERLEESDTPILLRNPAHAVLAVACTLTRAENDAGESAGRVLVMRDVSREHALSRELAWQASHDPLTNLPNRREFERQLKRAIDGVAENGVHHSLCYVDLDQFKIVNDTCGHSAGDRMLRQIAGLLATELRDHDVLARLGGDEFGVLLRDTCAEDALAIANRLCAKVSSFRFECDGQSFDLGASIGLVPISEEAGTVHDVQRAADMACYAAKETGRNRVHLYRHEDHVISRNQHEMQWHTELRRALEEGRFQLHAQPVQALHGETSVRRMDELLLRLVDDEGEMVPPTVFLPAAERYGLMGLVDRMVIEKAFSQLSHRASAEHLYTINLSGQSLSEQDLAQYVLNAAGRHRVSPRGVCFEITETAAISNFAQAVGLMHTLRREGFRFALDDFGAGVSSFGYLKQLPVDFLKIDGQFVHDISTDPVARVMVSSIISVARVLQIETVAEKVEEESARRCLVSLGTDYVQGYLIGRPASLDSPTRPVLAYSA